ncbi:MAG: nucleotidyltransferase family protein [Bacteroidaceae bacterium]|nr:nucleotidyltransferase family protein [Bacteroidaceae bacterium]
MKCLILAAGYATRLYPLTENFPKPLLTVGDKTILDWLIDDLNESQLIDEYIVVTNHRFSSIFEDWAEKRAADLHGSIHIVDDGTCTNETRLGAVRDIELGIRTRNVDDDLLVMAGDNLLSFSLKGFIDYAREKGTSCIMRYYEPDENRLHKCGVVEIDADGLVLSMEEKPAQPKSHWCCPPFYCYRKEDLKLVPKGIDEGCGTDAPGSFVAWLSTKTPVHAWEMPGERFDIGSLDTYEEAKRKYGQNA